MIDYIIAHYQDFFAILGAVVTVATLVVKLTPSQKDDAIMSYVVKFLDYFSTVNPKK